MTKRTRRVKQVSTTPISRNGKAPTIKTPSGLILHLLPVDSERIYYIQSEAGRPEPPVVQHEGVGGVIIEIPDENDEQYLEELGGWRTMKQLKLVNYACVMGVMEDPPESFGDNIRDELEYYTGKTPHRFDIKWEWLKSLYRDHDDGMWAGILELSNVIIGLVMPTEKGIENAEDSFPGRIQAKPLAVAGIEELEASAEEED